MKHRDSAGFVTGFGAPFVGIGVAAWLIGYLGFDVNLLSDRPVGFLPLVMIFGTMVVMAVRAVDWS